MYHFAWLNLLMKLETKRDSESTLFKFSNNIIAQSYSNYLMVKKTSFRMELLPDFLQSGHVFGFQRTSSRSQLCVSEQIKERYQFV